MLKKNVFMFWGGRFAVCSRTWIYREWICRLSTGGSDDGKEATMVTVRNGPRKRIVGVSKYRGATCRSNDQTLPSWPSFLDVLGAKPRDELFLAKESGD